MARDTGKSPLARGVNPTTHAWRIARLRTFERAGQKVAKYWHAKAHTQIIEAMKRKLQSMMLKHERAMMRVQRLTCVLNEELQHEMQKLTSSSTPSLLPKKKARRNTSIPTTCTKSTTHRVLRSGAKY
jgi:hypothetical protein